jgi:hypothetical protein
MLVLVATGALAQKSDRFERIHAAKVAFVTDRLHLSSDQSARFWPVYDRYETELRELRKKFLGMYNDGQKYPEADGESRKLIDDNFDFQEQQLALKRRYKDEFLKILTPTQVASLYIAEREFKRILLDRLKDYPTPKTRK